ncbi:AMP-binding protein [Noviherbaspirillum massiliense]|uniref:AMP-binding protein n=1 Tax=Noviherbaspirillum massiliense TaxID=1465823 RepID=UPI00031141F2|nr:AMP-binding protein [Noviherbaspirillum massiliense]
MSQHWIKNYPAHVNKALAVPPTTIIDGYRQSCERNADKQALISMDVPMTFRELRRHADCFTSWLQQIGIQPGDRVALMMPNILAYPVAFFGALQGGYIVVNVNPLYTPRELAHQLKDSGARVLVVLENFAHVVQQVLPQVPVERVVVVALGDLLGLKGQLVNLVARHIKKLVPEWHIERHVSFSAVLQTGRKKQPDTVPISQADVALLQYTGGTTGISKGAVLTHGNLMAHETIVEEWARPVFDKIETTDLVGMAIMPLYHITALMLVLVPSVLRGGRTVLIANPRDLEGLVKTMRRYKVGMLNGINTLYNALLNHPDIGKVDFSSLMLCGAGGAATQEAVADRWQQLTGKSICEGFGMSETSGALTINRIDDTRFRGAAGLPVPLTDISIRDDEGNVLPVGEPGEVCAKGPQVMRGYWNRPEETAKAMTADGYLRTGDIGYFDESGYLHIVDRKKDMILVSGFNVFPNEVEEVLAAMPDVLEAAVIGIEDDRSGEAVCAMVVPRDASLTKEAVMAHCRANLTPYKCPKIIEFRTSIPKTPVGKILRRALREEFKQQRAGSEAGNTGTGTTGTPYQQTGS